MVSRIYLYQPGPDTPTCFFETSAITRSGNSLEIIRITPNPFSKRVAVFVPSANDESVKVGMFAPDGKQIKKWILPTNQKVNLEPKLLAGIYFLKVEGKIQEVSKVVIS